jgi:hypothetical protein
MPQRDCAETWRFVCLARYLVRRHGRDLGAYLADIERRGAGISRIPGLLDGCRREYGDRVMGKLTCWSCQHYRHKATEDGAWVHLCAIDARHSRFPQSGADCDRFCYEPGSDEQERLVRAASGGAGGEDSRKPIPSGTLTDATPHAQRMEALRGVLR